MTDGQWKGEISSEIQALGSTKSQKEYAVRNVTGQAP